MKNNIIQFCLKNFYSMKGWFRSKKFKVDQLYYGGVNDTYGYYKGDNTFYETKNYTIGNVQVTDSKPRKYTNLQLGLFKWQIMN